MKEVELAEKVIEYLGTDYDIYSEVIYSSGSKRADIIAVKDNEYISIETKMSMNLTLLEQSFYWKDKVHKSYICFPSKRYINSFARKICEDFGIGILIYKSKRIIEVLESSYCEDPDLPKLHEKQKDSVAGSRSGGYITPFSLTRDNLMEYINENGRTLFIDAIRNIDHHYSNENSAKNSLKKMIKIGVVKLKLEKVKNKYYLDSI